VKKRTSSPSAPSLRRVVSSSPSATLPITATAAAAAAAAAVRTSSPPRQQSVKKRTQSPPRRPGGLRKSTGTSSSASGDNGNGSASGNTNASSTLSVTSSTRKVGFNSSVTVKKMPSVASVKSGKGSGVKQDGDTNHSGEESKEDDYNNDDTNNDNDNDNHDDDDDDDDELRPTPRDDSSVIDHPTTTTTNNNNNTNNNDITTIPLSDGPSSSASSSSLRVNESKPSPPGHTRRVTAPSTSAIVIRVLADGPDETPRTLTTDEAVRMLRQGREVNLYDGITGLKRVVMAWYEPPVRGTDGLGSFYYTLHANNRNNGNGNGNADQSLPLASLTDMTLGKDHVEFRRMASALYAPDNCCFSLVTDTISWHIHETSSWRADAWIDAVQYLLRAAGTLVISEQQALGERSRVHGLSSSSSSSPHIRKYSFARRTSSISVSSGIAAIRSLCRGREVNWWPGTGVSRRIYIYYIPRQGDLGTLYWCSPGQRIQVSGQSLPLATLTDISHGHRTRVFNTTAAGSLTSELRCFSLITNDGILDLGIHASSSYYIFRATPPLIFLNNDYIVSCVVQ
jgi:hypothetical protein